MLLTLGPFLFACGQGESKSSAINIEKVEWREEKVLVTGGWAKGVATPPVCRIREGRDGPVSSYFESDARASLDGNTFSKEFVPKETTRQGPAETDGGYYVRCSVSLDSGRSAEDVVRVKNAP